jgi:hypothetical protein
MSTFVSRLGPGSTLAANPARLADWVPTMRVAEPSGKQEVHPQGEPMATVTRWIASCVLINVTGPFTGRHCGQGLSGQPSSR